FKHSISNWLVYLSRSYSIDKTSLTTQIRWIYFCIYAVVAMTLSPIGEELLFRGIIFETISTKYNSRKAAIVDSTAFAMVHLAHFGIVFDMGAWHILWIPAILWFVAMYMASKLFLALKIYSESIWGAIFAHAGFNVMMMYLLFYHIMV
ncbi:MAG TPA: CPBP family intramembrane glutamic endopeptidase, partial [Cytophagales bacterium]|nr:CPBP family intramembrane glutamic endopeptidase [Cytophagales bacterium]